MGTDGTGARRGRSAFAAAVSTHPVTAHAVGEVVGEVLERLGTHPDLAVVFVTGGHAGALEDIGRTIRTLLAPSVLVGAASTAVIGPGADVDPGPGIALWTGLVGPVVPVLIGATPPLPPQFAPRAAILVGDPTSPPPSEWSAALVAGGAVTAGGLQVVGGSTATTGLLLQDRVVSGSAVGAMIGPGVRATAVVSEGGRPIGDPLTVTRAERSMVYELDGRPAMERLMGVVADRMPADDVRLVNAGLRLAVLASPEGGIGPSSTFVVRGADRGNGALGLDGPVDAGATVRFEVRDPHAATEALQRALAAADSGSGMASGTLLFRSLQRDATWFGPVPSDAAVFSESLPDTALAGCATAVELGPDLPGERPGRERAAAVIFDLVGPA